MVYTENTPNPNAIKFISEKTFSKIEVAEFNKRYINAIIDREEIKKKRKQMVAQDHQKRNHTKWHDNDFA